jgi:hypothetical protein
MLKVDVTLKGKDLLQLAKVIKVTNNQGKQEPRPLLHRLSANLLNLCAMSAQEAVAIRMGKEFNIRRKEHSGRFPSFIQNQVKFTKRAYAKDFASGSSPSLSAALEIPKEPSKSNRDGIPLILSLLEEGGERWHFMPDAKRLAIPADAAREGGTFKGKVATRYRWDRLNLRYVFGSHSKKRGGGRYKMIRGGSGDKIYSKYNPYKDDVKLTLWKRVSKTKEVLLYSLHDRPVKQKKAFDFYDTAKHFIYVNSSRHFRDLMGYDGDDRPLKGQFKWATY